jgi:hypothetical protein
MEKVVEVQEFEFPPLQQPKVTPTVSKPLEANSDIANMIDGAVSASLNNKFVAMSEKFESTMNSRLVRIEAKFGKQFLVMILMHRLLIPKILKIAH